MFEYISGNLAPVTFEVYAAEDIKSKDGKVLIKKDTLIEQKTGDDRNPLIWLLLLGIGGCMAGAAWYLRKKDEKDQNQDR